MADLSEFLRARIAEDEAVLTQSEPLPHWTHLSDTVGTFGPRCPTCRGGLWGGRTRALAECEAKRQMVDYIHRVPLPYERNAMWGLLALPYADHPDYREEWWPLVMR